MNKENKPGFRVPLMKEIRGVKGNGLTAVSTFAGCGGSSTGYRMAGYRVLWANEFDAHAAETYRANCDGKTAVDTRDIREVTAEEVLGACGLGEGELDVLDGSPPCQTFSTAGKREMADERSDLFFEYVRLLRGVRPRAFVAENVSGLVKGVAKGYFKWILREMKASGYRVAARVLDAQWLGVPQRRRRVIFVGVREDLGVDPVHPLPMLYRYSVRDACPWIGYAEEDTGGQFSTGECTSIPSPTVRRGGVGHLKARVVHCCGGYCDKETLDEPMPSITAGQCRVNVVDAALNRPGSNDIEGTAIEREWDKLRPGEQSEKYFQLQKVDLDEPCSTVCRAGGGRGVATAVLPTEKRKFTIAELKRVCAFPDDFALHGSYAQQWARLGNSVPPVMMFHIARVVADGVLKKRKGGFRFDKEEGWLTGSRKRRGRR